MDPLISHLVAVGIGAFLTLLITTHNRKRKEYNEVAGEFRDTFKDLRIKLDESKDRFINTHDKAIAKGYISGSAHKFKEAYYSIEPHLSKRENRKIYRALEKLCSPSLHEKRSDERQDYDSQNGEEEVEVRILVRERLDYLLKLIKRR